MTALCPAPPDLFRPDAFLEARAKDLDPTRYAYKLADSVGGSLYGMDSVFGAKADFDPARMSLWINYADGDGRDGGGDLLEIGGIDTSRHRKNPIVLFDHGKMVKLPIAKSRDPDTAEYTNYLDPATKIARLNAFFYQGKSGEELDGDAVARAERDLWAGAKSALFEHAVFCQQMYDMAIKEFVNGGSIGYLIKAARELPANWETGTPKGLHLLATLMLEGSLVVLPMHQDTVRKMLALPECCGKPLSPWLVKSLEPLAGEKKAVLGYQGKAFNRTACITNMGFVLGTGRANPSTEDAVFSILGADDWASFMRKLRSASDSKLVEILRKIDEMQPGTMPNGWMESANMKAMSAYDSTSGGALVEPPEFRGMKPKKCMKTLMAKYKSQNAGFEALPLTVENNGKQATVALLPPQSVNSRREIAVTMDGKTERFLDLKAALNAANALVGMQGSKGISVAYRNKLLRGVAQITAEYDVGDLPIDKQEAFFAEMDQAGYGRPKKTRWDTSGPTPKLNAAAKVAQFSLSIPPNSGRGVADAIGAAEEIAGRHGARLLGDPKTNNEIIQRAYQGKSMSQMQTKDMGGGVAETDEPPTDETEESPDGNGKDWGDSEPDEVYSAQVLRKLHQDAMTLLEVYDDAGRPLEHPEIKKVLMKKCEELVKDIEKFEEAFAKHHPDAEQLDSKAMEAGEEGEAEEADSATPAEEPPEEAIEGMRNDPRSETKYLQARAKAIQARYKAMPSQHIAKADADRILKEGEVRGHKLTERQRGMFGAAAGGKAIKWKDIGIEGEDDPGHEAEDLGPGEHETEITDEGRDHPGEEAEHEEAESDSGLKHWHKAQLGGAQHFLEEIGRTQNYDWGREHQMKAYHWHKALEGVSSEAFPEMQAHDEGAEVTEGGMPDPSRKGFPEVEKQDHDEEVQASGRKGMGGAVSTGIGAAVGGPVGAAIGGAIGDAAEDKEFDESDHKGVIGHCGGYLKDMSRCGELMEGHKAKAMACHKMISGVLERGFPALDSEAQVASVSAPEGAASVKRLKPGARSGGSNVPGQQRAMGARDDDPHEDYHPKHDKNIAQKALDNAARQEQTMAALAAKVNGLAAKAARVR
jgi:hypothetical protein